MPHDHDELRLRQMRAVLDHLPDATLAVNLGGRISEWNLAAEAMFGWSRAEVLDRPIRQFVPSESLGQFDRVWARLADGNAVPTYDTNRLHRNGTRTAVSVHTAAVNEHGRFAGTVATFRDRSAPAVVLPPAVVDASAANSHGDIDELTGLWGRSALQRLLTAPTRPGLTRAVAVFDVDSFALVNQTYGPDAGDALLREIGTRLVSTAGRAVVGRWQADEFLYIVDAPEPGAVLSDVTADALRAIREPLAVGDQHLYPTVSAGLVASVHAPDGDLFAAASQALRAAKAAGRDHALWFDATQCPPTDGAFRLSNELRHGIERGEMRLHYQPIVDLNNNNNAVGVEALVRWERPGFGLLAPADFIDAAECTGQIIPLGAWVTEQACHTAVRLAELGSGAHSMSINLSARQLTDPGVVDMLRQAFRDSGCAPSNVIIEVTETALMRDMDAAVATLDAIKALGVSLALDDFGTGYSSLLYLKQFPVDRIKIDRSFIDGFGIDPDDTAIVASTISLAHSVGVRVVAEGVETVDQLTLLRQMGCDFAQGYLFSRPLTLGQLQQWLPEHPPSQRRPTRATATAATAPGSSRILRMHGEGASLHTIAAALNVDGHRTEHGLRWRAQSVAKIITAARFPNIQLPR